jgi:hypothetical protein
VAITRIKDLSAGEQRRENAKQPIRDTAQSSTMGMSSCAKRRVVGATPRILLGARACPVIARVAQPDTAGIAHRDGAVPTALFRDRRDTHDGPQHVIRSVDQRLRSLGEHPGGDARPDPWHGADNSDVRMLALVSGGRHLRLKHLEQPLQLPLRLATLRRDQFHARQQDLEVGGHGVDHPRGGKHRGLLQHPADLCRGEPPDAVIPQQPIQPAFRQTSLGRGRGRLAQQRPQPRIVGRRPPATAPAALARCDRPGPALDS